MKINEEIARQLLEMYNGSNWTEVCLKSTLSDVSFSEATTLTRASKHNIAEITHHITYYVRVVEHRLLGTNFDPSHAESFRLKNLEGDIDWQQQLSLLEHAIQDLADAVTKMDDSRMGDALKPTGDSVYKSLHGVIEHCYYHLGQIVSVKKLLRSSVPQVV